MKNFNKIIKNFFRRYWKTALVSIVILCLCLLPLSPPKNAEKLPQADKIVHFAMFFTLAAVAFFDTKKLRIKFKSPIYSIYPITLGGTIEIIQSFIPARSGDWCDLLADILGVLVAVTIIKLKIKN